MLRVPYTSDTQSFNDPNLNEEGFPLILEKEKFEFERVFQSDERGADCLYKSLA